MKDIKLIERCVKGSLAVEGVKPSKEGEELTRQFLKGEYTSDETIQRIKKVHGF